MNDNAIESGYFKVTGGVMPGEIHANGVGLVDLRKITVEDALKLINRPQGFRYLALTDTGKVFGDKLAADTLAAATRPSTTANATADGNPPDPKKDAAKA